MTNLTICQTPTGKSVLKRSQLCRMAVGTVLPVMRRFQRKAAATVQFDLKVVGGLREAGIGKRVATQASLIFSGKQNLNRLKK